MSYHFESKEYKEHDEESGTTVTKVKEKRHVSKFIEEEIKSFKIWVDRSPDPECLNLIEKYLKDYKIINIQISHECNLSPSVFHKYRHLRKEFIKKNRSDKNYEYHFRKSLPTLP